MDLMAVRTATGSGRPAVTWRERAIWAAHRHGWEVRHVDPFLRLEDYLCRVLLPLLEVDCVFDVGAHVGEYATSLRRAGFSGDIVSFEPVSRSFEQLKSRADADPRWNVHQIALGDTDETREINVTATTTFSSLRVPRHDKVAEFAVLGNEVQSREQVVVRRLDSVMNELMPRPPQRIFLKLDTQGWDLNVLAGLGCVDPSIVGAQSEMSVLPIYDGMPDFRASLDAFGAAGFEIAAMFAVSRDQLQRLVEFDCVMLRVSAVAGSPDVRTPVTSHAST
jgi:FkbM family methyltransferase